MFGLTLFSPPTPVVDQSKDILLINDHHGVYGWQVFAQRYGRDLLAESYDSDTLDDLLAGPWHEWHNDAIYRVEQTARLRIGLDVYSIHENEYGIWATKI